MKKFILLLVLCVVTSKGKAQITITSADMPNTNDTIRLSVKTSLSTFNASATGPNYTWDYRTLVPDSQRVVKFVSASTTPYTIFNFLSSYGTINHTPDQFPFSLLGTPPSNVYDFYKENSSKLTIAGQGLTVSGAAIPGVYFSADVICAFPMNYLNVDSSNSGLALPLPGFGFYAKQQLRINTVDGWGTLKTPYGVFNTLRVKSQLIVTDSIYLDTLGFGITIPRADKFEYKWYGLGKKIPLLEIDATAGLVGGALTIDRVNWQDSLIRAMSANMISQSSCPIVNEGSLTVQITGGRHPLKYLWNSGDTTATISSLAPGSYSVTVTDLYGNIFQASDSVKTLNDSTCMMWVTFNSTKTCPALKEGSLIATQYGGRTPVSYLWSTGDTTSMINNLSPGTYSLTVTDKYGRQSFSIGVVGGNVGDIACLNIPTAFTPDGDGVNDVWVIRSLNEFPNCKLEIFNQWGSIIFKSVGYTTPWDGRYNGDPSPAGTYYYVLDIGDGHEKSTGTITIIR